MDASRLRQRVGKLERRRRFLIGKLLRPQLMIAGYLYPMFKKCGRRGCRCEREEKHGPYWCISSFSEKRTRLRSVGKAEVLKVKVRTDSYRHYQKMMAELRRLHFEVWEVIKHLRDEKIEEYPKADG